MKVGNFERSELNVENIIRFSVPLLIAAVLPSRLCNLLRQECD